MNSFLSYQKKNKKPNSYQFRAGMEISYPIYDSSSNSSVSSILTISKAAGSPHVELLRR